MLPLAWPALLSGYGMLIAIYHWTRTTSSGHIRWFNIVIG